ncbi:MAG: ADP-ribosylglycohydrolase family protein [Chloroflexota bacterium]
MVQPIEDGVPPEPLLPLRLAGAVWGHLVGDAVGVPYEFRSPEEIGPVEFGARGTYAVAPGTWSDDGAMMLALLDSLLTGRFDPEDQGQRYLAWADGGRYTPDGEGRFDIGNATAAALARIRAGTPAQEAGGSTDRDNGNGSLMRAIAVALVGRDLAVGGLADWAARASRVTHGHGLAGMACALYVLTARQLIRGQPERSDAIAWGRGELTRVIEERIAAGDPAATNDRTALDALLAHPGRAGRGYVADSFWSAWEAFAGASDYRDTIERAIRYGHDTDTTAAIAGGLAGAYWGLDRIPHDWLRGMRGRSVASPIVGRLLATDGWKTSTTDPLRIDPVALATVPGLADAPGGLAMTFLPGKQRDGWTGMWWRDVDADARRLRDHGADALFLLVEDHELSEARVPEIVDRLAEAGIETIRHPVLDMHVPADPAAFHAALTDVIARIRAGQVVVVACRGGLGRTGTAVGCLLVQSGMAPRDAIALTRRSRSHTIERDI